MQSCDGHAFIFMTGFASGSCQGRCAGRKQRVRGRRRSAVCAAERPLVASSSACSAEHAFATAAAAASPTMPERGAATIENAHAPSAKCHSVAHGSDRVAYCARLAS
eukprot:366573-Chlamydomonas_euryale.AAC.33